MKILLFILFVLCLDSLYAQTKLTQNTNQVIWGGAAASCVNSGTGTVEENSFMRVFDMEEHPIFDSVFVVAIDFAVDSTSGGNYDIAGRIHKLDGDLQFSNMTLLADDTVAVHPDSTLYWISIPIKEGYALPSDSIVVEVYAPASSTVIFYPGSSPYLDSHPSYISANACGLNEPTAYADLGLVTVHLLLNVWVNHKPFIDSQDYSLYKNESVIMNQNQLLASFMDYDNDTINLIRIESLPSNGLLFLDGNAVNSGDSLYSNQWNLLEFIPNNDFFGTDVFTFRVKDQHHWSNNAGTVNLEVMNWQVGLTESNPGETLVYPNPTADILYLTGATNYSHYELLDLTGRTIEKSVLNTHIINVANYPAGIYVLVLYAESVSQVVQFSKY